jgi:hypothetical protein
VILLAGQIQIGPDFLQSSFSILENQPMDMLLGLDMLKRHQVQYSEESSGIMFLMYLFSVLYRSQAQCFGHWHYGH